MKTRSSIIRDHLRESGQLKLEMAESAVDTIEAFADSVIRVLQSGGKVLLCGNGGSAADSQHIAAELVGRFQHNRKGMPALALTTDTSILTAVANDYGFDDIFRRQVEALGKKEDLLVGISTSGRSRNIVRAIEKAKEMGMTTVVLVGGNESPMADVADLVVRVPSTQTPRIQEGHIAIGHILCDLVEKHFFEQEVE